MKIGQKWWKSIPKFAFFNTDPTCELEETESIEPGVKMNIFQADWTEFGFGNSDGWRWPLRAHQRPADDADDAVNINRLSPPINPTSFNVITFNYDSRWPSSLLIIDW